LSPCRARFSLMVVAGLKGVAPVIGDGSMARMAMGSRSAPLAFPTISAMVTAHPPLSPQFPPDPLSLLRSAATFRPLAPLITTPPTTSPSGPTSGRIGPATQAVRECQADTCNSSGRSVAPNEAPPSTCRIWPVTKAASTEHSKATTFPTSAGVVSRRIGTQPLAAHALII
jgi:hypothetical protein